MYTIWTEYVHSFHPLLCGPFKKIHLLQQNVQVHAAAVVGSNVDLSSALELVQFRGSGCASTLLGTGLLLAEQTVEEVGQNCLT